MIVIADAGSTKISWVLLDKDKRTLLKLETPGYNPAIDSAGSLDALLSGHGAALLSHAADVGRIHFYGAGCSGDRCDRVATRLKAIFPNALCSVDSDMLAAARAVCGDKPGIACILGTGSNSCLYDGSKIVDNVSPLGFILGDEGSGAVLGRLLLGRIFKRQFSPQLCALFHEEYPDLQSGAVIERVYRTERPNAYLATFAPFLSRHIDIAEVEDFVTDEFERFFRFNIMGYEHACQLPVGFIGSIALNFAPQLREAASRCGCHVGLIARSPLEELIKYHGAKD